MSIFDRLFFRGRATEAEPEEQKELTPSDMVEQAISEPSLLYSVGDFPKYNPDDLIGRKGKGIYKKMCQDEQVKACLKFKKDAITSRGYTFQIDQDESGLSEDEINRRTRITAAIISKMKGSFDDVLVKALSAMEYGFSMTETIHNQNEIDGLTYYGIEALKLRPWDTFDFNVDRYGNVLKVTQDVIGSRDVELDLDKFIHFVVNPDKDEHYGESDLRAAYRAWFSKDVAVKMRNIYMERHAGGFHVITPPPNHTISPGTKEYNQISQLLSTLNITTSVLLPKHGYTIDSMYPTGSGGDIFEKTINQSDTQIARALLVPNLLGITPAGQTGSYSQSITQLEAFFWTLINDANRLAECINEQLFKRLGEVNFGDEWYPRFVWNPLSKDKAIEIIRLFNELVNSRTLTATEEDEKYIRDVLELPSVIAQVEDEQNGEEDENSDSEDQEGEDNGNQESADGEDPDAEDETIAGTAAIRIANTAFKRATSRVNFALIDRSSEVVVVDNIYAMSAITDKMVEDLLNTLSSEDLTEDLTKTLQRVKMDAKLKGKLNAAVTSILKQGETLGRKEAAKEIDKSKGSHFSVSINSERLDMIAEDFFKASSFRITGNISSELEKVIEAEIINGAKYDKSWSEVEQSVYKSLASKGMVSELQAKLKLADDLNVKSPDARLRTIVRTSTFEAINTARDSYFTDPRLGDFVVAYEYSGILDSRTTDICRHLDDDGAGDHSVDWYKQNSKYKPPNHFNCRSILVAVTQNDIDSYEEGPEPSIEPMEGFK